MQQHLLFLESDHYANFQRDNDGATATSRGVWTEAVRLVGAFVGDPRPESCVDEKTSAMEHFMAALLSYVRRHDIRAYLESYHDNGEGLMYKDLVAVLRKAGCHALVDAVCCQKQEQRTLLLEPRPRFIPLECTHGINGKRENQCPCCGITRRLAILDCLADAPWAEEEKIEVMVWTDAIRQGTKKCQTTGQEKQNKQRELQSDMMTLKELVEKFREQLAICIPHCQEIRWIRKVIEAYFPTLPADTLLIFTDFAAVLALRAFQTKNSSVDAHAVNDNFVCVYNRRICPVKEEKEGVEIQTEVTVFDVDVHYFFAETLSKGKKTDHAMHNVCLDHLIEMYRASFQQRFGTDVLRHVVVWTDNAPTQYRCRQNFIKVASVEERHPGVKLTHCLAVVDYFKGSHDAIGKDLARLVKALELMGIRSPNALGVFKNCAERLQKTHDQTKTGFFSG